MAVIYEGKSFMEQAADGVCKKSPKTCQVSFD